MNEAKKMAIVDKAKSVCNKVNTALGTVAGVGALGVSAFAEGSSGAFVVTSDMIAPIQTSISSGLTVLVPIGIGLMATMVGISLIPRVIYKFL